MSWMLKRFFVFWTVMSQSIYNQFQISWAGRDAGQSLKRGTQGKHMQLSELLKKRVVFVSGKGGCGKTSISVFLALMAEQLEKRVLIVEMGSTGRIAPLFGRENKANGIVELTPYISAINLSAKHCFEDYAVSIILFHTVYKAFLDNSYVNNFLNAAPGLKEFLMLRKIVELENQHEFALFSKEPKYDFIVVDAPATGHGLSALEVPRVLAKVTRIGPLYSQAQRIIQLLANKVKTAFCIVTLAEEMPVCESEEYVAAIRKGTDLNFGPLFINSMMPEVQGLCREKTGQDELKVFYDYYALSSDRYELNQTYLQEIDRRFSDFHQILIPFQFSGLQTHRDFGPLIQAHAESLSV